MKALRMQQMINGKIGMTLIDYQKVDVSENIYDPASLVFSTTATKRNLSYF